MLTYFLAVVVIAAGVSCQTTGNDTCEMAPDAGPCKSNQTMYYFDSVSQTCKTFQYGGCRGNYNRFLHKGYCQQRCSDAQRSKNWASNCTFILTDTINPDLVFEAIEGHTIGECAKACASNAFCKTSSLSSQNICYLSIGTNAKCDTNEGRVTLDADRSDSKFATCMSWECERDADAKLTPHTNSSATTDPPAKRRRMARTINYGHDYWSDYSCSASEFKCKNGDCIDIEYWCDGVGDCDDGSDENTDVCYWQSKEAKRCGFPDIKPTGSQVPTRSKRSVNGQQIKENSWPWLVALKTYEGPKYYDSQFCGGSIISRKWILTAAHCVDELQYEPYTVRVTAGEHNIKSDSEVEVTLTPRKLYKNPKYNSNTVSHDVALVELREDLPLTDNLDQISPECFARPIKSNPPSVGTDCIVAGWGDLKENGSAPDIARQVEIPILSKSTCQTAYGNDGGVDKTMLCGGFTDGSKDTCQGDSGGPLMCRYPKNKDLWIQQGIVSWGVGCAKKGNPGVYTKIANPEIFAWIVNTITKWDKTKPPKTTASAKVTTKRPVAHGTTKRPAAHYTTKRPVVQTTTEKPSFLDKLKNFLGFD